MQRRVQLELADQCVSQVLHLGQIRALIVVQHTAENIDFQKCFAQLIPTVSCSLQTPFRVHLQHTPHYALRQLVHSTARACNSAYGRRSFGFSNGVLALIWWYFSQVKRRPAQLRLRNIRYQ